MINIYFLSLFIVGVLNGMVTFGEVLFNNDSHTRLILRRLESIHKKRINAEEAVVFNRQCIYIRVSQKTKFAVTHEAQFRPYATCKKKQLCKISTKSKHI